MFSSIIADINIRVHTFQIQKLEKIASEFSDYSDSQPTPNFWVREDSKSVLRAFRSRNAFCRLSEFGSSTPKNFRMSKFRIWKNTKLISKTSGLEPSNLKRL